MKEFKYNKIKKKYNKEMLDYNFLKIISSLKLSVISLKEETL